MLCKSFIRFFLVSLLLLVVARAAIAQPRRFVGSVGPVDAMAFTRDNKLLLATDYLVVEFDPETQMLGTPHRVAPARMKSVVPYNDGLRILSYSEDRMLRLWERNTGRVLATFEWKPRASYTGTGIPTMGISPDDDLIAVALPDHETSGSQLLLLDAETLETVVRLEDPQLGVEVAPIFSLDGEMFYTFKRHAPPNNRPVIQSTNLVTGEVRNAVELPRYGPDYSHPSDPPMQVYSVVADEFGVACGYTGREFSMGGYGDFMHCESRWESGVVHQDKSAYLFVKGACGSGGMGCPCPTPPALPAIYLSPRGTYVIRGTGIGTWASGSTVPIPELSRVVFSPDESFAAGRLTDPTKSPEQQSIFILRTATGAESATVPVGSRVQSIASAICSPQQALLSADGDEYIRVRRIDTGAITDSIHSYESSAPLANLVWGGGTHSLFVWPAVAYVFNSSPLDMVTAKSRHYPYRDGAISGKSSRFLLSAESLLLYSISGPAPGNVVLEREYQFDEALGFAPGAVAFSADDSTLLAASSTGVPSVLQIDRESGIITRADRVTDQWEDFEIAPSDKYALARTEDALLIYPGIRLDESPIPLPRADHFAITRGGDLILTAGPSGLTAYDPRDGRVIVRQPSPHPDPFTALMPSPDENLVYTCNGTTILEWAFPLDAAAEGATAPVLRRLLGRTELLPPLDENGDTLYDAGDLVVPPTVGR